MEIAILIILGKITEPISNRGAEIVASREEDQESWNATIKESWDGAIIDEIHVKFNCYWKTITMLPLGQQMYRSEDKTRMILYGDIENPITMRGPDRDYGRMPDFYGLMAFQYFHRIGYVGVEKNLLEESSPHRLLGHPSPEDD